MGNDVTDRLRAARPADAVPDPDAFDADLLARVRAEPIAARRTSVPRVAVPVAAGITLTAAAVYMLAGGPGDVGGPSSAAAITQTLQWLTPPPHTVLHTRAIETRSGTRATHEFWQSTEHPEQLRELETGDGVPYETSGDAFYDAATNTIYDPVDGKGGLPNAVPADKSTPVADPIVFKVRTLVERGDMSVSEHTVKIDGMEAWEITLKPGFGREPWSMWVDASNGKPIEVRDPSDRQQVIRWSTYEFLPDDQAAGLTTLTGAHPSARVVHDPEKIDAAAQRLFPGKEQAVVKRAGPAKKGDKKR